MRLSASNTTSNAQSHIAINPDPQTTADFQFRRERARARHYARRPKSIKDVLAQLITARGYGRIQATADFSTAWRKAAGDTFAAYTLPGRLKRGILEVTATNSIVIQELTFQKQQILEALRELCPDAGIRDIKFRIGTIG